MNTEDLAEYYRRKAKGLRTQADVLIAKAERLRELAREAEGSALRIESEEINER